MGCCPPLMAIQDDHCAGCHASHSASQELGSRPPCQRAMGEVLTGGGTCGLMVMMVRAIVDTHNNDDFKEDQNLVSTANVGVESFFLSSQRLKRSSPISSTNRRYSSLSSRITLPSSSRSLPSIPTSLRASRPVSPASSVGAPDGPRAFGYLRPNQHSLLPRLE